MIIRPGQGVAGAGLISNLVLAAAFNKLNLDSSCICIFESVNCNKINTGVLKHKLNLLNCSTGLLTDS